MTEDFSVNEREEPAPAITAADIGFLRDMATDWNVEGEISEIASGVDEERGGIWRKNTESCRRLSAHASRLADVLESFAGRSPAEVPPNWNEEVQKERERVRLDCRDYAVALTHDWDSEGKLAKARLAQLNASLDALSAAVWRSAQPHD